VLSSSASPKYTKSGTIAQASSHQRVQGSVSGHMGIVVEIVALGQASLRVLQFFPVSYYFTNTTFSHLSLGNGTMRLLPTYIPSKYKK
jgi:hypothetical protein